MAIFSISGVKISGIAACVPPLEIYSKDYEKFSSGEQNLFIKTVGVESRRMAEKGITTLDLCLKSAEKLISGLNWKKNEIQFLIFVTQSKDYFLPGNGTIAQDKLKLSKGCMAFDISLGCSGYVYGLSVAASIIKGTGLKKGLLLAGDISTVNCSYNDKSTYPLFGDAGTATAIENTEDKGKWSFNLFSDGSGYDTIIIPDGGIRNLISKETSFENTDFEGGISRTPLHLALKGLEVFNFAIKEVPQSVRELLNFEQKSIKDFDFFVMHQANRLMNETIRKKLGIEIERTPYSLQNFGNTSSASIPLTLVSQLGKDLSQNKTSLLLSGFGVGLSWGNLLLSSNKIICPEVMNF